MRYNCLKYKKNTDIKIHYLINKHYFTEYLIMSV